MKKIVILFTAIFAIICHDAKTTPLNEGEKNTPEVCRRAALTQDLNFIPNIKACLITLRTEAPDTLKKLSAQAIMQLETAQTTCGKGLGSCIKDLSDASKFMDQYYTEKSQLAGNKKGAEVKTATNAPPEKVPASILKKEGAPASRKKVTLTVAEPKSPDECFKLYSRCKELGDDAYKKDKTCVLAGPPRKEWPFSRSDCMTMVSNYKGTGAVK